MNQPTRSSGFTLIELMVVVIIIAALAGMVLPRVLPVSDEAKSNIARGEMANISLGLKLFRLHTGRYPTTAEGLGALQSQPGALKGWKGPYLESDADDPWDRPYHYASPATHNTIAGFDIWSDGPSEETADDDVTSWEE